MEVRRFGPLTEMRFTNGGSDDFLSVILMKETPVVYYNRTDVYAPEIVREQEKLTGASLLEVVKEFNQNEGESVTLHWVEDSQFLRQIDRAILALVVSIGDQEGVFDSDSPDSLIPAVPFDPERPVS